MKLLNQMLLIAMHNEPLYYFSDKTSQRNYTYHQEVRKQQILYLNQTMRKARHNKPLPDYPTPCNISGDQSRKLQVSPRSEVSLHFFPPLPLKRLPMKHLNQTQLQENLLLLSGFLESLRHCTAYSAHVQTKSPWESQ